MVAPESRLSYSLSSVVLRYVLIYFLLPFTLNYDNLNLVSSLNIAHSSVHLANGSNCIAWNSDAGRCIKAGSSQEGVFGTHRQCHSAAAYVKAGLPISVSNVRCGEIVLGVPTRLNDDGCIEVDIGAESPLTVAEETLMFLGQDERQRLNQILESHGQVRKAPEKPLDELLDETVTLARQIPDQKRMTQLCPKLKYANDFKKDKGGNDILSYDLGVCGEIRPKQLSIPRVTGRKQPHCWFRDDQMEFVVTDVNTFSGKIQGEVWSTSIVERKRQAYTAFAVEAVKPSCSFASYTAVIKERDGDLLFLKLLDEHLEGFNAYALALPKDNPGDRVMVYLAGADPGVQQVYFTRRGISNDRLRNESLKMLYDEIMYHYVKTGKWFRAEFEEDHGDALQLRLVGKPLADAKYTAQIFLSQLPYFNPEGLLNETFKRLNSPNEYFCYHDLMINVGKLNYTFHYDNSMFVRIHEYKVKSASPADRSVRLSRAVEQLELTTLNVCNPKGSLEDVFQKLTTQSIASMNDLKIYSTYPSKILGQDDGYIYLAINYQRKPEFTLDDDYFVGIMKIVPKSKQIPIGSFVNARVVGISQNHVNMHYLELESEVGGYNRFKYTPFTYWLSHINNRKQSYGLSRFEEQKNLSLIWMDGISLPPPGSPQYDKFLPLQPIITESATVGYIDESLTPFLSLEGKGATEDNQESVAPEIVTQNLLRAARQRREIVEGRNHVPIDMKNFGCYTFQFDDDPDEAIAAPCYYLYNREIRLSLIEEELNARNLWKFKRTMELARLHTEGEIKEFFYDSRGQAFFKLLNRLSDPIERRKLRPKDALFFERNIKVLLSGIQDFYLESIYDNTDREKLMFASIVPRSNSPGDFMEMDELAMYDRYIQHDFVMNQEVRESIRRILRILTHPNNSLLAHIRNRHRNIPDDVFFYYRKTLHYDTWVDYKMPEAELLEEAAEDISSRDAEGEGLSPMPPLSVLVKNPEGLSPHLMSQGLSQVKGLYAILMKLQRTPTSETIEKTLARMNHDREERADELLQPEDVYFEAKGTYMTDGRNKSEADAPTTPRQNLRITSKEWRKLNQLPRGFNPEELKQYLREIKMYNPVHGVKLPML